MTLVISCAVDLLPETATMGDAFCQRKRSEQAAALRAMTRSLNQ